MDLELNEIGLFYLTLKNMPEHFLRCDVTSNLHE